METASQQHQKSVIPFIAVLFVMVLGSLSIVKSLDIPAIKAAWAERRCELAVMATAPLFQPADDTRTAAEFAMENFDFCMKNMQQESIKSVMAPVYEMSSAQLGASTTVATTLNNLRATMSNTTKNTMSILLGSFYTQFKQYAYAASLTMQRLRMAFDRITASTNAMLYMALSTVRAILNGIDFVLLVAIIMVTILAIIFIILFFILFPSIPLILSVLALLVSAGAAVGDLRDTFCFAPHTLVHTEKGDYIPISQLRIGVRLAGGGIVKGMYTFNGTSTPLYDLHGVHVAGDHIVLNHLTNKWCYVKDHPHAITITNTYGALYCPVVDNRRVPVLNSSGSVFIFKDWEELETESQEREWESWVWRTLNGGDEPDELPVYDYIGYNRRSLVVKHGDTGTCSTPISAICIGDLVEDISGGITRVTGAYRGVGCVGEVCGNLIMENSGWRRSCTVSPKTDIMYHLVTESGTFIVNNMVTRDATDVGSTTIDGSYGFVIDSLNNYTNS
jgi:hypothetical protein